VNFFPFHPGDYMLRTAHLELLEDLAYRRLIDLYYVNEKPIEGTPDIIARIIRMRSNTAEVEAVLREFFIDVAGSWRHNHCDEVIAQYQARAKQAAENGKRGGRPKKPDPKRPEPSRNQDDQQNESQNNPAETQPVNSANPEETGSKANQEPITKNQNQEDQKTCAPPAGTPPAEDLFAKFWKLYPKKQDKAKAQKAWAKLKVTDDLFAVIAKGLSAQVVSADWVKEGGKYVPMPTTWLNGKRWEDEVPEPAPAASNVHPFPQSRHTGFADRDYQAGLIKREDGIYAL
jgi:uncharacterized protein YdaU (DUF1376 family)